MWRAIKLCYCIQFKQISDTTSNISQEITLYVEQIRAISDDYKLLKLQIFKCQNLHKGHRRRPMSADRFNLSQDCFHCNSFPQRVVSDGTKLELLFSIPQRGETIVKMPIILCYILSGYTLWYIEACGCHVCLLLCSSLQLSHVLCFILCFSNSFI